MKTNLKWQLTISALCLVLSSCGNNSDIPTNTYNTISGTLAEYKTGTVDSLKCFSYDYNDDLVGKCAVSTDGKFSITLSIPTGNKIAKINNVTISDTNAIVSIYNSTKAYKNGIQMGVLYKSNVTNSSSIGTGSVIIAFWYSDRDLTIKGTDNVSTTQSIIWDVALKKGWNEIAMEIPSTQALLYTTTIPHDLSWRLFPKWNEVLLTRLIAAKFWLKINVELKTYDFTKVCIGSE